MDASRFRHPSLRALFLAVTVGAPWFLGIGIGMAEAGSIASFGAYLLAISFPPLPARRALAVVIAAALVLTGFALVGSSLVIGSVTLLLCAAVACVAQALAEMRGGALRVPVALATLALFLFVTRRPHGLEAIDATALFGLGTLWAALMVWLAVPRSSPAAREGRALTPAEWTRFVGAAAALGLVGGFLLSFVPLPHPGWLPAAALRVLKPTRQETWRRMRQRGLGSLGGAALAGVLLGWGAPPILDAALITLLVFAMLIVGPRRYGTYTFCLTVVALAFTMDHGESILEMALDRVLLTAGGIVLALSVTMFLPSQATR